MYGSDCKHFLYKDCYAREVFVFFTQQDFYCYNISVMVVVITGGSSGIGLETARLFSQNKQFIVYVLNRHEVKLDNVNWIKCDVSNSKDIANAVSEITSKENNQINLLINNAGMGISGAIEYHSEEEINKIIDVNLVGLVNVTRAFLPYMNNGSKIINISSVAGPISIPFQTMYSVTKAGVLAFSNGLRNELRPLGIKVTSVLPGDTKTGFTSSREKSVDNGRYGKHIEKSVSKMEKDESNGVPASKVAKKIFKVSKKKNPNTYYVVGSSYKLLVYLSRILPKRLVNWIIFKIYG